MKPEFDTIDGPGEYEIHDVFVTGIRTHQDEVNGAQRGHNTSYLIELDGMVICHLGDLGHALSEEQAEAMTDVDVLLVPAGSRHLDPARAAEITGQLAPKVVIPMQYATASGDRDLLGLDAFCRNLGVSHSGAGREAECQVKRPWRHVASGRARCELSEIDAATAARLSGEGVT